MQLRLLFTSLLAAFSVAPVSAKSSAAQIVDDIRLLTTKAQVLQAPAQSITVINGPLIIVGQGPYPVIIAGYSNIITSAQEILTRWQGNAKVSDDSDAKAIYEAFEQFVRVNEVLLNILIGKAGLFHELPFIGQPVASVLRSDEGVTDTMSFSLIDTVESRAKDLQKQAESLEKTLSTAIDVHDKLSNSGQSKSTQVSQIQRIMITFEA